MKVLAELSSNTSNSNPIRSSCFHESMQALTSSGNRCRSFQNCTMRFGVGLDHVVETSVESSRRCTMSRTKLERARSAGPSGSALTAWFRSLASLILTFAPLKWCRSSLGIRMCHCKPAASCEATTCPNCSDRRSARGGRPCRVLAEWLALTSSYTKKRLQNPAKRLPHSRTRLTTDQFAAGGALFNSVWSCAK